MSEKELAAYIFIRQFGPIARHKGQTYTRKILLFAEEERTSGRTPDYKGCISRTALIYNISPSSISSAIKRWIHHSWEKEYHRETWHQVVRLDPAGSPPTPMQAIRLLCEAYLSGTSSI